MGGPAACCRSPLASLWCLSRPRRWRWFRRVSQRCRRHRSGPATGGALAPANLAPQPRERGGRRESASVRRLGPCQGRPAANGRPGRRRGRRGEADALARVEAPWRPRAQPGGGASGSRRSVAPRAGPARAVTGRPVGPTDRVAPPAQCTPWTRRKAARPSPPAASRAATARSGVAEVTITPRVIARCRAE